MPVKRRDYQKRFQSYVHIRLPGGLFVFPRNTASSFIIFFSPDSIELPPLLTNMDLLQPDC